MNYPANDFYSPGEVIDAKITGITPAPRSLLEKLLALSGDSFHEQMQQDAELASFRSHLTEFALARVGAASVMEQHISTIAPHAAARCRAIVDASTMQAIEQIRRW